MSEAAKRRFEEKKAIKDRKGNIWRNRFWVKEEPSEVAESKAKEPEV